jgi:divalent metal cation (Fe/Co/Zn/Cd) transporter
VIVSAVLVALGFDRADPIVGLAITALILRITWQAWRTIRDHQPEH